MMNNANNNKLQSIKNADESSNYAYFEYDACGNMTKENENRYQHWDAANQLLAYVNQAGTSEPSVYAHYLYSGGKRVKKLVRTQGGGVEVTVYIDGIFEHRYNSSNDEQTVCHVMDDTKMIASMRLGDDFGDTSPSVTYHLDDHLGSSCLRLSNTGALVDREEYYPFGDSSLRTFSKKRYRYCGKEKDEETGLYYYGARYHAPWLYRFISVDPKALEYIHQGSYVFAGNNPVKYEDVNGEGPDGGNPLDFGPQNQYSLVVNIYRWTDSSGNVQENVKNEFNDNPNANPSIKYNVLDLDTYTQTL